MNTWQQVLSVVEQKVNPQSYNTWFKPTEFIRHEGRALYIRVPNAFFQDWLNEHIDVVVDAARQAGIGDISVLFMTDRKSTEPVLESAQQTLDFTGIDNTLNPNYTFDTFVVGSSNQFAHAAAFAVAERPSKAYNPLFVYGGAGLGKTHLMHAIGHEMKRLDRSLKLTYVTTEKFTNELINAIRYDKLLSFRERYRNNDVLLIDDIQFIAGKEATQNEFFHTFNALYDNRKQIVISADNPPHEIQTVQERLQSRFKWGLIADILMPDLETKVAILTKKAAQQRINLPQDVAIYIASKIKSNIRELEGALVRILAFASLRGSEITLPMAKDTLRDVFSNDGKLVTIEKIQKTVAEHYGLRVADLKSRTNAKAITEPRQISMYLAKKVTGASLPKIGQEFGNKHHTTVLHSIQKIEGMRQRDNVFNKMIQSLMDSFQ